MEIAPSNVVLLRSGDQVTAALKKANREWVLQVFLPGCSFTVLFGSFLVRRESCFFPFFS